MKKLLYIGILFATLILGVWGYRNYDSEYYKFCKSTQQDLNFKNLEIEEQFQIYIKYNCKYDSDPARIYWGFHIGEKNEAIDFLLNKLRHENNQDILTLTLHILRSAVSQHEIKGRDDIISQVKETVDKISEKDERGFLGKIIGGEVISRKERLHQIADEIEERTKMSKAEYEVKTKKERDEKMKKEMEKLVKDIVEKAKRNQANSK